MNSLEGMAKSFAEANRQEQKWLRDEVQELRKIIMCLIMRSESQEIKVYKKDLQSIRSWENIYLDFEDNTWDQHITITGKIENG